MAGGADYSEGRTNGPTADFVDSLSGWTWDRKGGDWIDAAGVRFGSLAWASAVVSSVGDYAIDVTGLVNASVNGGRWLAMLMRCLQSQRTISGLVSDSPPTLDVSFADGRTSRLACWITATVTGGTAIPSPRSPTTVLPAVLEFDKPAGVVQRATLRFKVVFVAATYGAVPTVELMLVDPPLNRDVATSGLAASYPLDVGIDKHPAVFGSHRYQDGSTFADFVSPLYVNIDDERVFDPALYGRGPEDKSLLPHKDLGKWIMAGPDWSLVDSRYTGDGFEPFAPGLGAMRIYMKPSGIKDGDTTGYDGTGAAAAKLYLPADKFGRQRRIFVRTGIRITRGEGYVEGSAGRRQVFSAATQSRWTEDAGKFFPMPSHNRTTGGVSGSGGGGAGWQTRFGWAFNDSMLNGPDENGWMMYGHFFDFQGQNPPGHSYANDTRDKTNYGQRGGLGAMLYFDRWYDVEAEILLNSVDQPAVLADGTPHIKDGVRQFWTPDGAWRVWVDGRLVFERTGLVFRSLPVMDPGFRPGYGRPCRELGAEGIWLNWYHGGVTQNVRPRVTFISGLVWSEQRIGPMRR